MGAQITYTLAFVTAAGTLLAQEQSVTIDRTTNSQLVSTVANGASGESPGAGLVEIAVENAVPAAGFEFQGGSAMLALQPTKVMVLGPGGQQLKTTVQIISDSFRHGVNNPASYSFRARGALVDWS